MTLLLTNEDMAKLNVPMADLIRSVETAFVDLAGGPAVSKLRGRVNVALDPERAYFFGYHCGAVPALRYAAFRFDSMFLRTGPDMRLVRDSDFAGLVLLFSLDTAEMVGILHDHWLSPRRVAATSAIVARELARQNSARLAMLGSGEQAQSHVEALLEVIPSLTAVSVFSPNEERRTQFVDEVSRWARAEVSASATAEDCVRGADIVVCATNARTPVLAAEWIGPGTHLCSIVGGDEYRRCQEIDEYTVAKADVVICNLRDQVRDAKMAKLLVPIEKGMLSWDDVYEVGELLVGKAPRRTSPEQITLHDNNGGMGIQFAAAGGLVYERALASSVGLELDSDLFMTRGGTYAP